MRTGLALYASLRFRGNISITGGKDLTGFIKTYCFAQVSLENLSGFIHDLLRCYSIVVNLDLTNKIKCVLHKYSTLGEFKETMFRRLTQICYA